MTVSWSYRLSARPTASVSASCSIMTAPPEYLNPVIGARSRRTARKMEGGVPSRICTRSEAAIRARSRESRNRPRFPTCGS